MPKGGKRSVPNGIRNETTFGDENDDIFITNTLILARTHTRTRIA